MCSGMFFNVDKRCVKLGKNSEKYTTYICKAYFCLLNYYVKSSEVNPKALSFLCMA